MKGARTQRLDSVYQQEIARILSGSFKNKLPSFKGLISVTATSVAPDLKTAKVYVSIFATAGDDKAEAFKALQENAGFIRHELSQVMQMRTVPALTFVTDDSMEYGAKMDELLAKIHKD